MQWITTWSIAIACAAAAGGCGRGGEPGAELDEQALRGPESGTPDAAAERDASARAARRQTDLRVAVVANRPDNYADKTVSVVGEVEGILEPQAFVLRDDASPPVGGRLVDDLRRPDDDLVVLAAKGAGWSISEAQREARIRARGRVQRLPVANLEQQVGRTLSRETKVLLLDDKVVIIASEIEPADTTGQ